MNLDGMGKDRASKVYIVMVAMTHDSTSKAAKGFWYALQGNCYHVNMMCCQTM